MKTFIAALIVLTAGSAWSAPDVSRLMVGGMGLPSVDCSDARLGHLIPVKSPKALSAVEVIKMLHEAKFPGPLFATESALAKDGSDVLTLTRRDAFCTMTLADGHVVGGGGYRIERINGADGRIKSYFDMSEGQWHHLSEHGMAASTLIRDLERLLLIEVIGAPTRL